MNKNIVKITYAEPWLPFHHRLFINIVETCSARIALKKRYASQRRGGTMQHRKATSDRQAGLNMSTSAYKFKGDRKSW